MATSIRAALAISIAIWTPASFAAEVAGVTLEPSVQVAGTTLMLNGAGLRKKMFFKVYVIGLYVAQSGTDASALIAEPGPKRVAIHMLREVGADAFSDALRDGIRDNHSEAQAAALEP